MASKTRIVERGKGIKRFLKELKGLDGLSAFVGVAEKDGSKFHVNADLTVAELAQIHEFGAPSVDIPSRSFLRATFDDNQKKYDRMMVRTVADVLLRRRQSAKSRLMEAAEEALRDVLKRIDSNIPPPLADSTVRSKGHNLALVDTGQLRDSISAEVRKE